jgi:hypothetical protein
MELVSVDPNESKYTNLDLWNYRCAACGNTVGNFVARTA